MYGMENAQVSVEELLGNTLDVVLTNRDINKKFMSEFKPLIVDTSSVNKFTKKLTALLTHYETINPLFCITECAPEEAGSCCLSRQGNPLLRETFETRTSCLLQDKIDTSPKKSTVYTSFGSGEALSELIIIAKTLQQKPTAHISINCIDNFYKHYVEAKKQPSNLTIPNLLQRKKAVFFKLYIEALHKQFTTWLTNSFPQACITLQLYDSVQNYLEFSQQPADVISAVDFLYGDFHVSQQDYTLLCLKTMHANPSSMNIAFDLNILTMSHPICLCILSTQKENDEYQEFELKNKNDSTIPMYALLENI